MKCVAIGAGILAYKMQGIQCPKCKEISDESLSSCPQCGTSLAAAPAVLKGMSIAEKTVQNYLVEVLSSEEDSRKLKILVEKGTPVPMDAPVVYTFRTTEDGQTAIRIPVYQGMASTVQQNQLIGTVEYDLSRKLSLNHPVQVEFRISRNRNIEITIDDGGARQEKELKLGLRQEMTNQPQPESTTEADEEEARAERERILSVLDSYIAYAGDFVNEYGHLLTAQEKQSISAALEAAAKINDQRDAENAVLHSRKLSTMLGRCGTASLIAQAYAAASNTPDATIQSELREKADQLKRAAENRDRGAINALTDPVASLVRQVHESHEEVARIYAVKKHGRLLREG